MVDKPGCTTLDQLNNLKNTVKETGKIWSVNFSERFHVAAVAKAEELVAEGKIGKVKQTIGTGPHIDKEIMKDLIGFIIVKVMEELLPILVLTKFINF
jgi:predicted dehydrogenase